MTDRTLRRVVRAGIAHWGFGNLYEEVVRMPERVAERPSPSGSPLGPGEPARYYLPAAPLTVAAAVVDAVRARRHGDPRPVLTAGALVAATGIGVYLIRTVNVPLVSGTVRPDERAAMVARWHRWNRVRLGLLGVAAVSAGRDGRTAAPGPGAAATDVSSPPGPCR